MINTTRATYIDVYTPEPVLSNVIGGLSWSPILPVAVRVGYEVYKELRSYTIGVGGYKTGKR